MIVVRRLENTDFDANSYFVDAFADTKAEVEAGAKFKGLPEGAKIELGSTVMTAEGNIAFMKSDGTWSWQ